MNNELSPLMSGYEVGFEKPASSLLIMYIKKQQLYLNMPSIQIRAGLRILLNCFLAFFQEFRFRRIEVFTCQGFCRNFFWCTSRT